MKNPLGAMMQQAQKMQEEFQKAQEELAKYDKNKKRKRL